MKHCFGLKILKIKNKNPKRNHDNVNGVTDLTVVLQEVGSNLSSIYYTRLAIFPVTRIC